jgi:hypothetical protein
MHHDALGEALDYQAQPLLALMQCGLGLLALADVFDQGEIPGNLATRVAVGFSISV